MVPGMIGKDYFRRQAKTLRNMVKVAQDQTVADRLNEMADDFEARAADDYGRFGRQVRASGRGAGGEGRG